MLKMPAGLDKLVDHMMPYEGIGLESQNKAVSYASGYLSNGERVDVLKFLRGVLASDAADSDLHRLLYDTRWYTPRDPAQSRGMLERYVELVAHPIFDMPN